MEKPSSFEGYIKTQFNIASENLNLNYSEAKNTVYVSYLILTVPSNNTVHGT